MAHGASVAISARRAEKLRAIVGETGRGMALAGDATDRDDMHRVADSAAEAMGGIDLMVYVAGYGVLQRLIDTDPKTWTDVYRVNVVGANLATAAALEHMDRNGVCAYVSSRTVGDANAYFASYSASKAALDQCIRTWRVEHPNQRFVRIVMGNAQPTEFANQMGFDMIGEALETWQRQAIPGGMMHSDDVGAAMAASLAITLAHPDIDASELKFDARPAEPHPG